MSKTEMVHIVDMTAEDFRVAADWHRLRGQDDTADSMMRLPPMLATLSKEQKVKLRRLSAPVLQAELTKLVLLFELEPDAAEKKDDRLFRFHVAAAIDRFEEANKSLDVDGIVDDLMSGYGDGPGRGPEAVRDGARKYLSGLVRDEIAKSQDGLQLVEIRRLGT